MKKKLSLALAALMLGACASNGANHASTTDTTRDSTTMYEAPANLGDNVTVEDITYNVPKAGDTLGASNSRNIAQSSQRWIEDSRKVSVGPGGGVTDFVLTARLAQTQMESFRVDCDKYTWGTGTCQDYQCQGGVGKSELWNAYYGAPKEKKAAALDAALAGVGLSAAQKLHNAGIFNTKARSWQDFQARMNDALRKQLITTDQYREVLSTHRERNRTNLGYAGTNCKSVAYSCETYGLFRVPSGCVESRPVERVINTLSRKIALAVSNPQLQAFETEDVTIAAGDSFDSIRVIQGDKTVYEVNKKYDDSGTSSNEAKAVAVELKGIARNRVALPAEVFQEIRFNDRPGENMNAVVKVNPKYIGSGEDRLMVTLRVSHCAPGGFFSFGNCKGSERTNLKVLEPIYHTITQETHSFALPAVPAGHRVIVDTAFHRENSPWYSNSPSAVRQDRVSELKK